ncbi:unnamed protein product, partial [Prorocentrum cordatum]
AQTVRFAAMGPRRLVSGGADRTVGYGGTTRRPATGSTSTGSQRRSTAISCAMWRGGRTWGSLPTRWRPARRTARWSSGRRPCWISLGGSSSDLSSRPLPGSCRGPSPVPFWPCPPAQTGATSSARRARASGRAWRCVRRRRILPWTLEAQTVRAQRSKALRPG